MIVRKEQNLGSLSPQDETPSPSAPRASLEGRELWGHGDRGDLAEQGALGVWEVLGCPGDHLDPALARGWMLGLGCRAAFSISVPVSSLPHTPVFHLNPTSKSQIQVGQHPPNSSKSHPHPLGKLFLCQLKINK